MTPNYFLANLGPEYFSRNLYHFKGQIVDFLQIGVFAGSASIWMLDNVLTHPASTLTDVDTWKGSEEHSEMDFAEVEKMYDLEVRGRTRKIKLTSDEFFANNNKLFDFIYIDGDHSHEQVLRDGQNAIKFIKENGIIAFDDYVHPPVRGAIDRLIDRLIFIEDPNHQAWFKIKAH